MIRHLICSLFILGICSAKFSYAQYSGYTYQVPLSAVTSQWHSLSLPPIFHPYFDQDLRDVRIIGIAGNDTTEIPYIWSSDVQEDSNNQSVAVYNQVHNASGYYYDFDVPSRFLINAISLRLKDVNFDWSVQLQGSEDKNTWYTIVEDYRIVGYSNESAQFQYATIHSAGTAYPHYRLLIKSASKPQLSDIYFKKNSNKISEERLIINNQFLQINYPKNKNSIVDIYLDQSSMVAAVEIAIADSIDYHRQVKVQVCYDSILAADTFKYLFKDVYQGYLRSGQRHYIQTANIKGNYFRLLIDNKDNQPLTVQAIQLYGFVPKMIARFNHKAMKYLLLLGKENATRPMYDLVQFADQIPTDVAALQLGNIHTINNATTIENTSSKYTILLWVIVLIMIGLLGYFTINMLRKSATPSEKGRKDNP